MKNDQDLNNLLDLTFKDLLRECEAMGINTLAHSELIEDMWQDGFDSYEVKEMIEVIEDRDLYAYIPEL